MYFYVYKDRCDIAFIMRIKESACNAGDPGLIPGSGRSLKKERLPTAVFYGFPGGSGGKECPQCERPGFTPWVGTMLLC